VHQACSIGGATEKLILSYMVGQKTIRKFWSISSPKNVKNVQNQWPEMGPENLKMRSLKFKR